jgi:uncharacterized protein (DUF58 family)
VIPLLPSEATLRRLDRLRLDWRAVTAGSTLGSRRAQRPGQSREFQGLRPYEVGDDLRDLDWAATLRFDRPYLRQYREEVPGSLLLLIDTSASMGFGEPSKLAYAQGLGCALGYLALAHHDPVGLLAFADGVTARLPAGRGNAQWSALRSLVETLTPRGITGVPGLAAETPRLRSGRGLCVIISDFSPPGAFSGGLSRLAHGPLSAVALHLLSREEIDPGVDGELELVDLETGEARGGWIGPTERTLYRAALADLRAQTEQICRASGIRYVPISTGLPVVPCLQETLVRAGILRRGGP